MRTILVSLVCVLLIPTAFAQKRESAPSPGDPLAGLTAEQRDAFNGGHDDFVEVESVNDGLGPVFNERSCAACHTTPAIGGGSARFVTRFARVTPSGVDPLAAFGGTLIQDHAIGPDDGSPHAFAPETVPAIA